MKKQLLLLGGLLLNFSLFAQVAPNQAQAQGVAPPNPQQSTTYNPFNSLNQTPVTGQSLNVQQFQPQAPATPTGTGHHFCKTHQLNQQHYADRGVLNDFNQDALQGAQNVNPQALNKTPNANEIAVIFHVVHNPNNPAENVSNALIMQVFNDLSEDFQLLNANAASARTGAPFNFVPADANINFCLATKDPGGTPLTEVGVVRVATTEDWYDSDNGEENKMKATATGGSQIWDRNQYLNIWVCDISNGAGSGTAGYAYRPSTTFLPSAAIDGIVLDYNLGMNNENVLTHEVGHYLGLDHPWGGSGGCGNDDGFADTPVTDGPSFNYPGSCSGSQQTCGAVEVQYENYMDYANCTVMFTQNQADYMLSILQGIRSSLLLSPGCDPVDAPPVVDFTADIPNPIIIPVGGSVNFFSLATNNPNAWTWDFGGGSPNQTVENPTAVFNTVGLYTVTHTATNAFGTGTETKVDHVQVVPAASGIQCDTLRNYVPSDPIFVVTGGTGYITGNTALSGETALEWAEPYTAPLSTEVRRLRFAPAVVSDGGGSIIFKVYGPGATPGAVLATETVPLANLAQGAFNEINFATPATVTGNFWVGYELSYANAADTFALFTTVDQVAPITNYSYANLQVSGWTDVSPFFIGNPGFASIMDVLTSNGPAPVASFTLSETAICAGGDITVNGSGSTNTTDYLWYVTDFPITTIFEIQSGAGQTFTHPTAGNEAITLLADGSCMTDILTVPVTIHPTVTATANVTHTTCGNNNGVITVTGAAGGDGNYTYSLDGTNWQTSNTFNNMAAGTYTIYIQTPGDNCLSQGTVTVNASTPFVATVAPNVSFCPGGTATLSASGGTTYQWFDGGTTIANTATTTVTPANTTQYSCLVTDALGCQSTVYQTVTVYNDPATPTITAGGPLTFCDGGSVDLTTNNATGNVWSPGSQTTQTITVTTSGTYTVTYTDANGCSATSAGTTVTVNALPAAPTVTPPGPVSACNGGTVNLTSSYATGNVWSPGSQTTQTITASATGTYTVTHTDANGCSATSAGVDVTVEAPIVISVGSFTDPTTCSGTDGTITINGSSTGTVSWTGTATGNSGGGVTLPYTITGLAAGSYTIDFTSDGGCTSNTLNQTLTDPTAPAAPTITPTGPITVCNGGSQVLTSSYATGNVWSPGSQTTQTITVTTSGTYSVTHTDGNGCSSTSTPVTVTVEAPIVIAAGTLTDPTTCGGLDGSIVVTGTGTGTVSWTGTASGNSGSVTLPYTITGLGAGSYTIDFTSSAGCTSNTLNETLSDPVATVPTITPSGPTTFCAGGSVDLTSSEATGNVWSPGSQTTQTITVTTSGTYTVTYTDAGGCTATSVPITVTVDPTPTITIGTVTSPTACGTATGNIEITGTGTGTVSWTGAATGNSGTVTLPYTITGLAAGSYTINFMSSAGCASNTLNQTLNDPAAPAAPTITPTGPITVCNGGSQVLTSSYATGNVWSPGSQTTQTITVTASGTYSVTHTDINGCSSTSTPVTITVEAPIVIAAGTLTDPTTCGGLDGSIVITGTGTGTVSWTGTASGNSGSVTLPYTITGLGAGSYTIDFTSSSGCTSNTLNETLSDPVATVPTITPSGPTTFCAGGSVDLTSSEATGNVWSPGSQTTQTITVTTSGTYTVTYTDAGGCTATSTPVTVTVDPTPTITTGTITPPVTCGTATGSIEITGTGTGDVSWTGTASGNAVGVTLPYTITGLAAGAYNITFTSAAGCPSNTLNETINDGAAPPAPTITASGPLTFCDGGSVDLTSSYATGNDWTTTETTQTVTVTTSGTYSVTYTDGTGCTSTSTPVTVTVNSLPAAPTVTPSGPTTFCDGGSVDLTSSEAVGNNWSTTATTQTINVTTSGAYTVTYTDGNGCTSPSSTTVNVTVNATPTPPTITSSGPTTFCDGASVDLTSSQATGNGWSTTATTQTITVNTSGSYTVTYTDPNGCSATSLATDITVNTNPAPPVITPGGSTTICAGQTVDLTSSEASGNTWSTTETTQTIAVSNSGSYTVTYTDANGCSATSAPIVVNGGNQPTVSAGSDQTVCEGTDVTLAGAGAMTYTWNNGVVDNVSFTPPVGANQYVVIGIDANGCTNTDTVVVTVSATPIPTLTTDATTCVNYAPSTLVGSPAGGTYLGAHVSTDQFDPASAGVGTHTVYYEFTNGDGCTGTASTTIVVEPCASVEEIDGIEVRVYPNPVRSELSVELPGDFNVTMYDARGRVVLRDAGADLLEINTSMYESGMYLLTISSEAVNTTVRVIKE